MKKPNLLSALAIAAVASASLALPATASASSFKHEELKKVHGEHYRDHQGRRDHGVDHRYIGRHRDYRRPGNTRWAPSPSRHDRGHHYGHYHGHRYDYRPVERYRHYHDDDVRLRIFYDLHL